MIAYQLYSSRNHGPMADTFALLSRTGYTAVEGYGAFYDDPPAIRAALDAAGLTMPSGHVSMEALEDAKAVIALARTLGLRHVFAPYLAPDARPSDAAGWRAFAARLDTLAAPLRDSCLTVGWHNHDFEFTALPDGSLPIDHLMDGTALALEMDVAWIVRAGQDPLPWIDRYGRRTTAVHVKDIAPEGENADQDGWADPGDGVMDWPAIAARLEDHAPALWIAEHDNPSDDARFARRAMATMQGLGMGA